MRTHAICVCYAIYQVQSYSHVFVYLFSAYISFCGLQDPFGAGTTSVLLITICLELRVVPNVCWMLNKHLLSDYISDQMHE